MAERIRHYFSYDGETELPEEGVADYHGRPHYFWLRESLAERRTGVFDLALIDSELLGWVDEAGAMWHEWDVAYHAGEVEVTTHPKIAGNNPRFVELAAQIEQRAQALRGNSTSVVGVIHTSPEYLELIRPFSGQRWPIPGLYSPVLEVTWREAP
jgi:hypothetical protein